MKIEPQYTTDVMGGLDSLLIQWWPSAFWCMEEMVRTVICPVFLDDEDWDKDSNDTGGECGADVLAGRLEDTLYSRQRKGKR